MEEETEHLNLELKFAFVCKGKLERFYEIEKFIENLEGVELVYTTKSRDKLFIAHRGEVRLPNYIREIQKLMKKGKSFEEAKHTVLRRTGYGTDLTEEEYERRIKRRV